ncbi:MAG: hypothetical protein AAEJ04_03980 [Planctomycetota bacterium]
MTTGVASVFPEVGIAPFAHARANFLDIEAGVPELQDRPILTMLVVKVFSFFGLGISTLKIFSVLPFLFCIVFVFLLLARRRGDAVAILAALLIALQPTFLPWASVPGTVSLVSLLILVVAVLAGRRGKSSPWKALALCFLLSWGISPLIMVAAPACLLEGIRRALPVSLRPMGFVVTFLVTALFLTLQQLGADPETLAMGISGSVDLYSSGTIPSLISVDPGWLIAVIAALIVGPRARDDEFQPIRILLVTGLLPWILAGSLPVFPLVVLFPAGILLMTDVLADRGRQVMASPILLGKAPKTALVLITLAVLFGTSIATASSAGSSVRIAISFGLVTVMVGALVTIRAGLKPKLGISLVAVATFALLMPVNLHRIAHEEDRWQIYREELNRILPHTATLGGRWAHVLVVDSTRIATREIEGQEHVIVRDEDAGNGLILESYSFFGDRQSLVRRSGVPTGIFENACALHVSGRRAEARSDFALILKADPGCSAAWERFGVLLLEDGIEDLAAECLYFSLQSDPRRELPHRLLASLYARKGMLREASHHLIKGGEIPVGIPPRIPGSATTPLNEGRR